MKEKRNGGFMEKNRHIVVKMVLFFLILFGIGILLQLHINRILMKREVNLDDSWQISIDGTEYDDVRLSEFHMPATKRGTEVILKRTLPEETYSRHLLELWFAIARYRFQSTMIYFLKKG